MAVSEGLVRASRIMAWLSMAGAVIVPLSVVALLLVPDAMQAIDPNFRLNHLGVRLISSIPLRDRLFALPFALVPAAIATFGLVALTQLLRGFAEGKVFTPKSLRALGHVPAALFWNVVAAFFMGLPISYFLTAHSAHHELQLVLGSDDVTTLFVAGVAFVIARVMAEARRVADENASFV